MANIAVSEKSYKEIEEIAFSQRTTRKDVTDKMIEFVNKPNRIDMFIKEMF